MASSPEPLPETMQALVLADEECVKYTTVPCPRLVHPGDAIVRVTACSVCGRWVSRRQQGLRVRVVLDWREGVQ